MKKIVLAAIAATVVATPAFAQTSDSTTISGSVALVCTIDAPTSVTVDLAGTVQSASNVVVQCNSANGYAILASSDMGGTLKHATTTSAYAYSVMFSDGAKTGTVLTTTATPVATYTASVDQKSLPLSIRLGALSGPKFAGIYGDTIRMSVLAN